MRQWQIVGTNSYVGFCCFASTIREALASLNLCVNYKMIQLTIYKEYYNFITFPTCLNDNF